MTAWGTGHPPCLRSRPQRGLSALHDHHHDPSQCDHDHGPKHIYIYSPSSAVRDKAAFKRGIARLKAQGHEVEVDVDALATHTRFAGDDATRLAAIHRAAASGADVALISRGGYGLTRILPGIRYKAVAKAIEKGMHFVGVSDFTAFQLAVLACPAVTAGSSTIGGSTLTPCTRALSVNGLLSDGEARPASTMISHTPGTGFSYDRSSGLQRAGSE